MPPSLRGLSVNEVERQLTRLRKFNAAVESLDAELAEEANAGREEARGLESAGDPQLRELGLESISMRRTRPVLAIKHDAAELRFIDEDDATIWQARLAKAAPLLDPAIRAVGRINLDGASLAWIGTGWLVADYVLVTNRHVARAFARRNGDGFTFKLGEDGGPIGADVDFLEEIENDDKRILKLKRPLYIEERDELDIAFFEVERSGAAAELAKPLRLAAQPARTKTAAVIGYPAYDSRIPDLELMERIFQKRYNKKRLAPGAVTMVEPTRILHNCTTLCGNSGSAVVDLDSGEVVGLHFSGTFLTSNYAVRADLVRDLLDKVRSGRVPRREARPPAAPSPAPPRSPRPAASVAGAAAGGPTSGGSLSLTIPLTITVSLGAPAAATPMPAPRARVLAPPFAVEGGEVEGEEAVAEDYRDREGYDAAFLGADAHVSLPRVAREADDVLAFDFDGARTTELKYMHYSVVMSRSRRMCFFSACNIDGKQSKKSARVGWKWDPRISKSRQIMNECYGKPPKFSRGHMTRREDPGWGDDQTAKRGNQDSMHVTNTTPQMQAFNAPIWLALEDYALQHAREDEMQISVFTGPYLTPHDPDMYGVQIPLAFWKVIAFIYDDTGKLCATGYEMTQESTIEEEQEFVFGAFTSPQLRVATQVPIRAIEQRAGLSFGPLASVDPLAGAEESLAGAARLPLQALEQPVRVEERAAWPCSTSFPFRSARRWRRNYCAPWRISTAPSARRCDLSRASASRAGKSSLACRPRSSGRMCLRCSPGTARCAKPCRWRATNFPGTRTRLCLTRCSATILAPTRLPARRRQDARRSTSTLASVRRTRRCFSTTISPWRSAMCRT
jgi:endonuclease G